MSMSEMNRRQAYRGKRKKALRYEEHPMSREKVVGMSVAEFDTLRKRDFENGAVLDEIRCALKDRDSLKVEIERAVGLGQIAVASGAEYMAECKSLKVKVVEAHQRHTRYLGKIGPLLCPSRKKRGSGEPALPDWKEIELLIADRDRLREEVEYLKRMDREARERGKRHLAEYGITQPAQEEDQPDA